MFDIEEEIKKATQGNGKEKEEVKKILMENLANAEEKAEAQNAEKYLKAHDIVCQIKGMYASINVIRDAIAVKERELAILIPEEYALVSVGKENE